MEGDEYDFADRFFEADPIEFNKFIEPGEETAKYHISLNFGGIAAEAIYSGEWNWTGANSDLYDIIERQSFMLGIIDHEYAYRILEETIEQLQKNWTLVQKIAGDLIKFKTVEKKYFLDQTELHHFFEES